MPVSDATIQYTMFKIQQALAVVKPQSEPKECWKDREHNKPKMIHVTDKPPIVNRNKGSNYKKLGYDGF